MRGSRHSTLSLSFKNSIPFSPFFENGIHRIQNHTINIQSLTSLLILLTNCQVEKLPSGLCDFLEISCAVQKARHIQLFSLNYPLFALKNNSEHNARSLLKPFSYELCMFLHITHSSFSFVLQGSFFNHSIIGLGYSPANMDIRNRQVLELPWRSKPRLP